jgi:hypothetical protein
VENYLDFSDERVDKVSLVGGLELLLVQLYLCREQRLDRLNPPPRHLVHLGKEAAQEGEEGRAQEEAGHREGGLADVAHALDEGGQLGVGIVQSLAGNDPPENVDDGCCDQVLKNSPIVENSKLTRFSQVMLMQSNNLKR